MEQQVTLSVNYGNKYNHYEHSVGKLMLHLEWCTKYRYKMFQKEKYLKLVEACVRRAASLHGFEIIEINVQPEHIHCVVSVSFCYSVSKVLQIMKGTSSRLFFIHHEKAKLRYPRGHLWSRGKFAASVGFTQLDKIREYVRNQDEHHSSKGNRTL